MAQWLLSNENETELYNRTQLFPTRSCLMRALVKTAIA